MACLDINSKDILYRLFGIKSVGSVDSHWGPHAPLFKCPSPMTVPFLCVGTTLIETCSWWLKVEAADGSYCCSRQWSWLIQVYVRTGTLKPDPETMSLFCKRRSLYKSSIKPTNATLMHDLLTAPSFLEMEDDCRSSFTRWRSPAGPVCVWIRGQLHFLCSRKTWIKSKTFI